MFFQSKNKLWFIFNECLKTKYIQKSSDLNYGNIIRTIRKLKEIKKKKWKLKDKRFKVSVGINTMSRYLLARFQISNVIF